MLIVNSKLFYIKFFYMYKKGNWKKEIGKRKKDNVKIMFLFSFFYIEYSKVMLT